MAQKRVLPIDNKTLWPLPPQPAGSFPLCGPSWPSPECHNVPPDCGLSGPANRFILLYNLDGTALTLNQATCVVASFCIRNDRATPDQRNRVVSAVRYSV